ncbi:MAG: Gx transporter family protein [Clostridiales bacterium]|nr:Gx transporter family protein [Candidatus Blautia equi]
MKVDNKKLAFLGIVSAVAIIFGYVESLVPVFMGIPGVKLGLANLAVLFVLHRYTLKEAAAVSLIRILVIGFMFGNMMSIIYSIAGAALSMIVMKLMLMKTDFSLLGVSVAGGVTHNIGQLLIYMCIMETTSLSYYAPVLIVSGVATGLVIGYLTQETSKRIHL